ncbi:MAG: hypothetical protein ACK53L_25500 [Pirellulaceae bacterium]
MFSNGEATRRAREPTSLHHPHPTGRFGRVAAWFLFLMLAEREARVLHQARPHHRARDSFAEVRPEAVQPFLPQQRRPGSPEDWLPEDWLPEDWLPEDWLLEDWLLEDWLPEDWLPEDWLLHPLLQQGLSRRRWFCSGWSGD